MDLKLRDFFLDIWLPHIELILEKMKKENLPTLVQKYCESLVADRFIKLTKSILSFLENKIEQKKVKELIEFFQELKSMQKDTLEIVNDFDGLIFLLNSIQN